MPVTVPQCVRRIYDEVIIPAGWGHDDGAGTRFIQSNAGTLGLTIEYKLGVHASDANYTHSGYEAMFGVGETSINKWLNDETFNRLEDRRWGIDLRSKIENASSVWHHDYHQGMGLLLEKFRNPFKNTIAGLPDTPTCDGLIYSFQLAQNIIAYSGFGTDDGHSVPVGLNLNEKATQGSVYYKVIRPVGRASTILTSLTWSKMEFGSFLSRRQMAIRSLLNTFGRWIMFGLEVHTLPFLNRR